MWTHRSTLDDGFDHPGGRVEQGLELRRHIGQREAVAAMLQQLETLKIGVWGRIKPLETILRDRDRIEVYRPLTVDPKEARRLRYKKARERVPAR